jgi:CBS domain-containing protein
MQRKIIPDVIGKQEILTLPGSATVREAARRMRERHVGSVLITKSGRLEGIFTERDVVHRVIAAGRDPDQTALSEVMTRDPDTVRPDATAIQALRMMQDGGYRHLPVLEDGRIRGVVSRRDFFGLEKARLDEERVIWEKV